MYHCCGWTLPRFAVALCYFLTRVVYHCYVSVVSVHSLHPLLHCISIVVLAQHVSWFQRYLAKGTVFSPHVMSAPHRPDPLGSTAERAAVQNRWKQLRAHFWLLLLLVVGQAALHGWMTIALMRRYLSTDAHALQWGMLVTGSHVLALWLTAKRLIRALRDAYAADFIDCNIAEQEIIYNISWEDPSIERKLLKLGKSDVILTISSAGCNVLDYLIESPRCIVACDLNEAQVHA